MGRRALKQLLLRPSCSYQDLCNQYDQVINMFNTLEHYTKYLRGIPDLERLHRKIALKSLEPIELHNLLTAYENIQMIVNGTEYQDNFNEMLTFCLNRFNLTGLQTDGVYYNIGINEELDKIYKKREDLKKKLNSESIRLSQILDIPDSVKWEYSKGDCNMYATPSRANQLKKKDQSISSKKSTTQKELVISEKINN
jgi:DNA mismatch repair ATPase MutS